MKKTFGFLVLTGILAMGCQSMSQAFGGFSIDPEDHGILCEYAAPPEGCRYVQIGLDSCEATLFCDLPVEDQPSDPYNLPVESDLL